MEIIGKISTEILNPLIRLLFAGALLYFLWGMYQFIKGGSDNSVARQEGQQHMIYGVLGMAIMLGVYGLLNILNSSIASLMG